MGLEIIFRQRIADSFQISQHYSISVYQRYTPRIFRFFRGGIEFLFETIDERKCTPYIF